jgi:hypothetical protein
LDLLVSSMVAALCCSLQVDILGIPDRWEIGAVDGELRRDRFLTAGPIVSEAMTFLLGTRQGPATEE